MQSDTYISLKSQKTESKKNDGKRHINYIKYKMKELQTKQIIRLDSERCARNIVHSYKNYTS